jgi:hypothetical protein
MAIRKSVYHGNWSEGHRRTLLGGKHIFTEGEDWARRGVANRLDDCKPTYTVPASVRATIEAAWRDLGPAILANWQTPDCRPWAWWLFDSPEPRNADESQSDQLRRMGC